MPTSVTGICSRHQRGFTLLELLVVIVLIAIVSAITVLSVNVLGRDSELSGESERLERLIEVVREHAQIQSRDYGLNFHQTGYRFLAYSPRTGLWEPVIGDPVLRERSLPPGLRFTLWLEGREVVLQTEEELRAAEEQDDEDEDEEDKPPLTPQVFILSNGDVTPFELKLEREGMNRYVTFVGQPDGTIEVKLTDEENGV